MSLITAALDVTMHGDTISLNGTITVQPTERRMADSATERAIQDSCVGLFENMAPASIEVQSSLQQLVNVVAAHWPLERRMGEYDVRGFASSSCEAYCCPGGTIFVSDNMVALASTSASVEALLAHEMAHRELGHTLNRARRGQVLASGRDHMIDFIGQLLNKADTSQSAVKDKFLEGLGMASDLGGAGMLLSYSTSQEREADYLGLLYCFSRFNTIQPYVALLTQMKESGCQDDTAATEFRSHPPLQHRIATAENAYISMPKKGIRFSSVDSSSGISSDLEICCMATFPYMKVEAERAEALKKQPWKGTDSTYTYYKKHYSPAKDTILFVNIETSHSLEQGVIPDTIRVTTPDGGTASYVNRNPMRLQGEGKRAMLFRKFLGVAVDWGKVKEVISSRKGDERKWTLVR